MTPKPLKIIYDTDPGIDDSMALLLALASPELEVAGVTTVFGNHHVEQTTGNALCVLEVAGRLDIPVVAGAGKPLERTYGGPRGVHGSDGLGNASGGCSERQPLAVDGGAAGYIAREALAQPGQLTIVAVGPLTNLALALQREPNLAGAVRQVVIMGGAFFCRGNASPVAEANIFHDPAAAAAVLAAPWPVVMAGLDVTMRTIMSPDYLRRVTAAGTPAAAFLGRIVPHYLDFYRQRNGMDGVPTHDPSAIAYAIDPSLFETQRLPVHVETEGRCAGLTVPDLRGQWDGLPLVDICTEVDSENLLRLFESRLAA